MSIDNLISDLLNLNLDTPSADSVSIKPVESLNLRKTPNIEKSNSNIRSSKSAMAQFKPEYLNCVPIFDGSPNDLNRYLATCQSLIDTFYDVVNPQIFQNVYLLNCLVGKLSGQAKLVVNIQNVTTWVELKDTLRRNFADQRDEACLNRDLVMMKQLPSEKPSQFYDRILYILNLLCSYIDSHENNDEAKILKRNLYNELSLKTFLSGLKEPLGTTIRCMRPTCLTQALQFVTQEYNVHYFQNQSKPSTVIQKHNNFRPMQQNAHSNNAWQPNFIRPNNQFNAHTPNNAFRPSFPSQPVNIRPNYNRPQQKFFTNSQVFNKPGNKTNVFRPNQQKQVTQQPTAMSGVETSMFKPLQSTSNYNPPKFAFEEIYNAETENLNQSETFTADENQYNYYDHYSYQDQPYANNAYYEADVQPGFHASSSDHNLTQQNPYEHHENNENFREVSQDNQNT